MKPLRSVVSMAQLATLIHHLENRRFSGPQILRLLKLYLGIDANLLIDEPGIYHTSNFGQISKFLKYHQVSDMINEVKLSELFAVGMDATGTTIVWFASPMFIDMEQLAEAFAGRTDAAVSVGTSDSDFGGLFAPAVSCNDACNVASSFDYLMTLTGKIIPPGGKAPAEACALVPTARTLSKANKLAEYELWCKSLTSESIQAAFELARADIMEKQDCGRDEACEILRTLITTIYRPDFIGQDRFWRASPEAREAWLKNRLQCQSRSRDFKHAVNYIKKKKRLVTIQENQSKEQQIQQHHPISPFEWQDPETQTRYYNDPYDGIRTIPCDMPPRPSNNAYISENSWTN